MTNELEIRERQKDKLYTLLELQGFNEGSIVKGLKQAIIRAKVGMYEEDIAMVEKLVAEAFE